MTKPEFSFVLPTGITVSWGRKDQKEINKLIEEKMKEVIEEGQEVTALTLYSLVSAPVVTKYFE